MSDYKGFVISTGYDANYGFYNNGKWIDFPEDIQKSLKKQFMLEKSFWRRVKFLFYPHF